MHSWYTVAIASVSMLFVFSGFSGCTPPKPDKDDYFPLEKGLSWEYRFQLTSVDKQQQGNYSVTNLGTRKIDSQTTAVRRTSEGRDYYLLKKSDGIYRYASRTLFETDPVIDLPERMVVPLPHAQVMDLHWSSTTTSYVIYRAEPSTITTEPHENIVMSYRISSENTTVSVPAGKFENCLLIEGEATLTLFADPLLGYIDVPIKTREWYAPGVGLIKLERSELLDTRIYKGGVYTLELVSFNN